jgi:predicted nucleotidyltransferase
MIGIERLLGALSDAGVTFILIGGVAARAHGSARITQDVDVSYSRSPENMARIVESLAPFEPYLRGAPRGLPFEWSVATLKAGLNFTLTTTVGDIDLLGEIVGGGRYEDLAPHAIAITIFGHETLLLDLPWLIHVKRAAGRPKDLEVIAELEALLEERERSSAEEV